MYRVVIIRHYPSLCVCVCVSVYCAGGLIIARYLRNERVSYVSGSERFITQSSSPGPARASSRRTNGVHVPPEPNSRIVCRRRRRATLKSTDVSTRIKRMYISDIACAGRIAPRPRTNTRQRYSSRARSTERGGPSVLHARADARSANIRPLNMSSFSFVTKEDPLRTPPPRALGHHTPRCTWTRKADNSGLHGAARITRLTLNATV